MTTHKQASYIIGIDEVGRGPLAGPVVVCAVAIPRTFRVGSIAPKVSLPPSTSFTLSLPKGSGSRFSLSDNKLKLRDSKKLSALQRGAWTFAIKSDPRVRHAIASISPRVIDRINVTQSANRAATRALTKLLATLPAPARADVFLDGGLFIRETRKIKKEKRDTPKPTYAYIDDATYVRFTATTVIKGDEHISAVSLASIVAKEHRDAFMRRAHKTHPQYGFDRHVGYGTKKHIAAIKANGRTPLHRNSFLKKIG